jgi:Na+-driven multidrug efflux pump
MAEQVSTTEEGDVRAVLMGMILPMVVSLLFIGSTTVVDSLFVGRLGIEALTAFGFVAPLAGLLFQILVAYGIGVTSVVARAAGVGDRPAVHRLITHSGVIGLFASVTLGLAVAGLLNVSLRAMGASPAQQALVPVFMTPWLLGMPFFLIVIWATATMRGLGNARFSALIFMIQALVNLVAVPVLVFGPGPMPALGFRGAALGTVASYGVASFVALRVIIRREKLVVLASLRTELASSVRAIFAVALPATLTYMLAPVTTAFVTALLARRAAADVAAYGVVARIFEGFLAMVPLAIASGLGPFVGHQWAAKKLERLRQGVDLCRRAALLWGLTCYAIAALAADAIAGMFADDPTLIPSIVRAIRILPLGFASYGMLLVANSVYNSIGQAQRATYLAALRTLGLSLPLAFVTDRLGPAWIFAALALGSIVAELVAARWLGRDGLRTTRIVGQVRITEAPQ